MMIHRNNKSNKKKEKYRKHFIKYSVQPKAHRSEAKEIREVSKSSGAI